MAKTKKEEPQQEEIKAEEVASETVTDEKAEKIAELEKELAASKEAHIRTLAEYDNYRKRSTKEKESTYADAKAVCMIELLGVVDNFERALAVTDSDFESFKKGTEMIYTNLTDTFKKLGVEAFGEKGEAFDPNFHNGVMHIDDPEMEENVIAEVFSKGYKLGDKVLRPAMVKVAN
ncbi:MAG: nucleotide exchange factor GrpE [Clostridia bacterium]|nr:nucleotide exchange factor GrpE [Clostridia bacterium]